MMTWYAMHDTQAHDKATTANDWRTLGTSVSGRHNWATLLHFIYFCYLLLITIYLITKLSVTYNFSTCREYLAENRLSFPSAPRADGTRDAEPNIIGPFYNLDGLLTHIAVQGDAVEHSADDADSDEAPAPPKPQKQKKPKAQSPRLHPKLRIRSH